MSSSSSSSTPLYFALALAAGLVGGYLLYPLIPITKSCHISMERCTLRTAMRRLWSDHVVWTRNYIISAIADLADLKDVTDRLLRNQDDIGKAVGVYYGADAGTQLTKLLKEHIMIAAEVVAAAKGNNKQALNQANEKWHNNAKDIAKFLSTANPQNWPYETILAMLNDHLEHTTKEAVARLEKRWADDIKAFDVVTNQALDMSDALTKGIAAQFPKKM